MKKNLLLSFILVSLISFAYWHEEIYKKQGEDLQSTLLEGQFYLVKKTDVLSLKTDQFEFIRTKGHWWQKDEPWRLDQAKIIDFLSYLSSIKVHGEMPLESLKDTKNPVHLEFKDSKNQLKTLTLLDYSKVTGAMYLKSSDHPGKILIAKDTSRINEVYSSDFELNINKYIRLSKTISSNKERFYEVNFFEGAGINLDHLKNIRIDNIRNRWFELNMKAGSITPKAFPGLKLLPFKTTLFWQGQFEKLTRSISTGQNILSNPHSEIVLTFENEKQPRIFQLFLGLNDKFGYYLKEKGTLHIYQVEGGEQGLFFSHQQSFWDKKIHYRESFADIKKLEFSLKRKDKKEYQFFVTDLQSFEVMSSIQDIRFIDKTRMNFLFNLLFGLTDFKQAKYIEKTTPITELIQGCLLYTSPSPRD